LQSPKNFSQKRLYLKIEESSLLSFEKIVKFKPGNAAVRFGIYFKIRE